MRLLMLISALFCMTGAASAASYFTGTLSSAQEVPTNSSTAVGFGRVTLNDAETQIMVSLTFSGLSSNQTASHIHTPAAPGVNAPVVFNIGSTGMTSGTFTGLSFAVTPAQVAALKAGLFYLNVHSTNFPGGEIRGQVGADSPFVGTLSNYQEVPANASAATGRGVASLNATGTQIVASLQFSGLSSNQTASHIHGAARPGVNAPILFGIGSTGMTSGTFTDLFFNITPAQVAQLKSGQFYFNVHSTNFPGGEIRGQALRRRGTVLDFDGDAKTDFAVTRIEPQAGITNWFISNSTGSSFGTQFGSVNDAVAGRLMGGDFDGDGKDDITIWRSGAFAYFYIMQSGTNTFRAEQFGTTGDDPRMIYDYDGDGRTDPAVYRSGPQGFLYYKASSANNPSGNYTAVQWGTTGDLPVPGDFDGDGKGDICVQRNVNGSGVFYCLNSTAGFKAFNFGSGTDVVVPGDYDGDGKTDISVTRIINGVSNWFPLSSVDGSFKSIVWGTSSAIAAQGDYDGDGKTDIAVWQPVSAASTFGGQSAYYVLPSNGSPFYSFNWGVVGDIPVNGYNAR